MATRTAPQPGHPMTFEEAAQLDPAASESDTLRGPDVMTFRAAPLTG